MPYTPHNSFSAPHQSGCHQLIYPDILLQCLQTHSRSSMDSTDMPQQSYQNKQIDSHSEYTASHSLHRRLQAHLPLLKAFPPVLAARKSPFPVLL